MADIREIIMAVWKRGAGTSCRAHRFLRTHRKSDHGGHYFRDSGRRLVFLAAGTWMILRDVSARRKPEEELAGERNLLSTLIETIPYHVYVKDLEGRYLLDNAVAPALSWRCRHERSQRQKSLRFFSDAELASALPGNRPASHENREPFAQSRRTGSGTGRATWSGMPRAKCRCTITAGKLVGLLCLSENITERKHAEEKLRHFAEQMERSNKELQEFASIASHDLQEPLRKIMAFGHRLRTKCGDAIGAQGTDYLDRMLNAAQRMQTSDSAICSPFRG